MASNGADPKRQRSGDDPASPEMADAVMAKQVRMVFGRIPLSASMTIGVVLSFSLLLDPFFEARQVLLWQLLLAAISAGRYGLWHAYRRSHATGAALIVWDRWFAAGCLLAGAGWGLGAVVLMPAAGHPGSLLLVAIVLGTGSISTLNLTPRLASYVAFLSMMLLPCALALWRTGGEIEAAVAFVMVAVFFLLVLAGRSLNRSVRKSIESEIKLSRSFALIDTERQRAQAASLAKTRFLANMSHELRTPLNAVIGAAQLLKAGAGQPESQAQMVDAIQQSGTNLLGLIESILDLSRIEAGELQLVQEDFQLADCVQAALATARLAADAKGLSLQCVVQPDVPLWRRGDPNRLRQVLLNLLGNAVKFTPSGAVSVQVSRGAQPDDLLIRLSDTGVGIGAASLPHIFEPFRQADDGADRRFGGSGLGLSIVHQLVQAMNGRIDVHSELGQGTRFDIALRLALAAPLPPPAAPVPQQPSATTRGAGSAQVHVLVVEDDLLNQTIVCRLLGHAGYTSTAASNGEQALALLGAQAFDLVLMDWQMPDMDGLEVTRRIRAGHAGAVAQGLPIIALTANAFAEDRASCLAAGMNDFLTKPVLADRLIDAVRRWSQADPRDLPA